jgi:CRP-like cAMP-binding protein
VATGVPGVFFNAKAVENIPAGSVIFEEGSSGSQMYGVVEGEIELRTNAGKIIKVGPEGTFGEMAIIDHSPRTATAVATSDSKLAVIDERTFLFLIHETPTFALQVMRTLTNRLRTQSD